MPAVTIVSQKLARTYWPSESAIGKRIQIGNPVPRGEWLTIVGVAGDVLYDWTDQRPEAAMYVPYAQVPPQDSFLGNSCVRDPVGFRKRRAVSNRSDRSRIADFRGEDA